MARPNTAAIKEFNIIQQFHDANIKTLINLQECGEHSTCGPDLEESGFSYNPQDFMDSKIYFYNFACPDFGASANGTILDRVRVMQFAISKGKVAIHCHAGLGRTGFLICAYLVFTNRMSANDAIHYVREKRPRAIQTRRQMQCLTDFAEYLKKLWIICTLTDDVSCEFTLTQCLSRQKKLLHGYEARKLKYIPKIIYFICERLLELAERGNSLSSIFSKAKIAEAAKMSLDLKETESHLSNLDKRKISRQDSHHTEEASLFRLETDSDDREFEKEEAESVADSPRSPEKKKGSSFLTSLQNWWRKMTRTEVTCLKAKAIAIALCDTTFEEGVINRRDYLKQQLNSNDAAWELLANESDPLVLAALLWNWLNQLKEPVLRYTDWKELLPHINDDHSGLATLEKNRRTILDYFSKVIVCLLPLAETLLTKLFEMLLSHLTHHYVFTDESEPMPKCDHWIPLESTVKEELLNFFKSLVRTNHKKFLDKNISH